MNARNRRYKKEAAARAKEYVALMHGYAGPQEKKAFKIAEKLRYNYWVESLAALPADEKRARLRAYRQFRLRVFFGGLFSRRTRTAPAAQAAPDGHVF